MLVEKLKERFGSDILESQAAHGEETIVVDRERAPEIMTALSREPDFAFNVLTDLTAVDWPEREPRFDVIYQLNSLERRHRLRVKVRADGGDPWVHSACGVWNSANWLEREVFDLFGIQFRGHPDLRRILLYDEFVGHPLRKDYPYQRRQPLAPEVDPITSPRPPSR
jgi:NADH-quinone oxidoreductase subunit C